jgi:hypothetical protein
MLFGKALWNGFIKLFGNKSIQRAGVLKEKNTGKMRANGEPIRAESELRNLGHEGCGGERNLDKMFFVFIFLNCKKIWSSNIKLLDHLAREQRNLRLVSFSGRRPTLVP